MKATSASATTDWLRAARTWPSSSPLSERAWLRIQKIIQVSSAAAARQMTPKVRSRGTPVRSSIVTWRAMPIAIDRSTAAPVPIQIQRDSSGRSLRRTAAKRIATIRAASNPSRSVIRSASPTEFRLAKSAGGHGGADPRSGFFQDSGVSSRASAATAGG